MLNVSITAYWMAAYRAIEAESTRPLFTDPFAKGIAEPIGFDFMRRLRWGDCYQWLFNTRTKIFDNLLSDLMRNEKVDVVVNLAAGFDMRPYRLSLDSKLRWIEVDHAEIIKKKNFLNLKNSPNCILERISCDLGKAEEFKEIILKMKLDESNVLILTEGLLVYLDRDQILGLTNTIFSIKSKKLFWIFDGAHQLIVRLMGILWNPVLASANCYLICGMNKKNLLNVLSDRFKLLKFESLLLQSKKFNKAPLSVRIMCLFSHFWLKSVQSWYYSLSGVYVVEKTI